MWSVASGSTSASSSTRRGASSSGRVCTWIASGLRPEILDEMGIVAAIDWQANLFLTAAPGGLKHEGSVSGAGLAAIEADAESRRWYVLGAARYLRSLQGFEDFQATGRVGLAPFLAEFEQINPWVVLQYQYMPGFQNKHVVTPMLRLLYQGVLLEVGSSLRGEWTVNFSAEL